MTLVLIAAGGAAGAVARYLVDGWIGASTRGTVPWGTLLVNLSGSFVLGVVFGLAIERNVLPAEIRAPVMTGFIASYTTFSTLMLESVRLWHDDLIGIALAYLVASVVLGLVALVAGLAVARVV
jgi:fluoride exporter